MSVKKEWWPYIHVFYGPKDDKILRFRATDGQGISKYATAHLDSAWDAKISKEFSGYVNPDTLNVLRAFSLQVQGLIQRGAGTVWVTPTHVFAASCSEA